MTIVLLNSMKSMTNIKIMIQLYEKRNIIYTFTIVSSSFWMLGKEKLQGYVFVVLNLVSINTCVIQIKVVVGQVL